MIIGFFFLVNLQETNPRSFIKKELNCTQVSFGGSFVKGCRQFEIDAVYQIPSCN